MSGGSQHNPNGRQSQLGSGWSPLQLQVANLLARAPQAHMASDRGVTWHTPTPPPHLYHVPAPSPPDPLQALKSAGGNSVFRHTATPPELYRHTPTPPDKHLMRHTPSPGDIKASAALPPVDLYQHLAPSRDKLRADDLMAYTRVGVDLSLGGGRAANGAATSPAPPGAPGAAPPATPALSVRDAPTINSLIARAAPRPPHARVDALLERLAPAPAPASPHSVIVHPRAAPTPSPPSSNEDSADSCGAPPGSKRKRKPERTVRVAAAAPPPPVVTPPAVPVPAAPLVVPRVSPPPNPPPAPAPAPSPTPRENGDAAHVKADGPDERPASPRPDLPHTRRKTRSGSAETIDDIAAMIANTECAGAPPPPPAAPPAAVSVDKLRSVLASPDAPRAEPTEPVAEPAASPPAPAAAPRRRSARSNPEAPNVRVESPSEAKPAEPEASDARTTEPAAASFVEVENQLEKMFAGIEEEPLERSTDGAEGAEGAAGAGDGGAGAGGARKRRRSGAARGAHESPRKKAQRKKAEARRPRKGPRDPSSRDAYDSGSNASSSKSRGPYIQIRGPRGSPVSVSVMNTAAAEEEEAGARRKGDEFRNGARGPVRGLHASTLGLRYDAATPDATWLCAFCQRGPHAAALGDLFGPYALDTDCDEYRALDEATRRRYGGAGGDEAWFHADCGVWAPGLLASGARVWGLASAVWGARAQRCGACGGAGAALACAARGCRARAHLPCAARAAWRLTPEDLCAHCPRHAPAPHIPT